MTEPQFRSATELAAMIRRRELSSRELLELFLARIEKQNPRLNAVVTLDAAGGRLYVPDWVDEEVYNDLVVIDAHYFHR